MTSVKHPGFSTALADVTHSGYGINIAGRLQEVAEPGGAAISGRVHEDVAGKMDIGFRDPGERRIS